MLGGDLLYLISGTVAVWILQGAKKLFKLEGRAMLWAAVIVCLALGVVTSIAVKDGGVAALLANPWLILTGGGTVFATAQLVYKEVAKKMDLPPSDDGGGE